MTGGTRGIGKGVATALSPHFSHLFLAYSSDDASAESTKRELEEEGECAKVLCVRGDLSLPETRDSLFDEVDSFLKEGGELGAVVHCAGQYAGITSSNLHGWEMGKKKGGIRASSLKFGDGSMSRKQDVEKGMEEARFYSKLYFEAFVDLAERGMERMDKMDKGGPEPRRGGAVVGISSPGGSLLYNPNPGYDMPGVGKAGMEYAMRLLALRGAERGVSVNVVIPGVTETEAWERLEEAASLVSDGGDAHGAEGGGEKRAGKRRTKNKYEKLVDRVARLSPMGKMEAGDVGKVVSFLCSEEGRWITGVSLPADGGVHLRC